MPVIHETPGTLDLTALTVFGISAKPNAANPIGYFGTGLKYAIAVLVREGLRVTVWAENNPFVFYCEEKDFRGKAVNHIRYKRQRGATSRWFSEPLPFTTELGRNWKLWMAYRELHSNTLDEGGTTYATNPVDEKHNWGRVGYTRIVVEGDAYMGEYDGRNEIFLPQVIRPGEKVQIFAGESAFAYYRGLRVHEYRRRALYTYNINEAVDLTEDRTAQHSFMIDHYIRLAVMRSTDEAFIKSILQAKDDTYESSIAWNKGEAYHASPEFLRGVMLWAKKETQIIYLEKKEPLPKPAVTDWRADLIAALEKEDRVAIADLCIKHKSSINTMLQAWKDKLDDETPF